MNPNPRIDTLVKESMLMMRVVMNIEDDGECWTWKGAVNHAGHPIIHLRQSVFGHKGCFTVRRYVFLLTNGFLLPRQPIGCTCGDKLCVNPAHLFQSTVSKVAKLAAKNGAWQGQDRAIKISRAKRATAKLDAEKAMEIRCSEESGPVLAARYGIDRSLVNSIKRGKVWRDYSSPFAGLGARA
jgi:hypothetical protein